MQTHRITLRHIRGACVSADIFINGEAMRSHSMANVAAFPMQYLVGIRPTLVRMSLKVKRINNRLRHVNLRAMSTPV